MNIANSPLSIKSGTYCSKSNAMICAPTAVPMFAPSTTLSD